MGFFGGGGASAGIGGSTGATDNAILRADGTGGATLQNSALVVDDAVVSYACTGVASTNTITAVGHNFTDNQAVVFLTLTGGANLNPNTTYFTRDVSGDTFKVATTLGGAVRSLVTDITAGTVAQPQPSVTLRNNASETNSALVLQPKGSGGLVLGPRPDGTVTGGDLRGSNCICLVPSRNNSNQVASGANAIAIGVQSRASASSSIGIGTAALSTASVGIAIGDQSTASSVNATGIGPSVIGNLRGAFFTLPFRSLYWSGTTTNNTATVLNLDGSATNRFTIAANTAAMVDLNIIARRTDTVDKWFSSRRMVAIRRNNANGTAIIGSVQTIGADQTEGSPTWSVAITADDTNEALQVEVTGATGETVSWRVMAFYQVV